MKIVKRRAKRFVNPPTERIEKVKGKSKKSFKKSSQFLVNEDEKKILDSFVEIIIKTLCREGN